ncbi:MAG: DNA repair protein RecO [Bacteroidota bacterium]|nr:DNA repair protein RecO [Bacteroidota bacterium]
MISKTQGIVLNRYKYTDNKVIVHIFTRLHGKRAFIIYNSKSKKKKIINLFQPLFILDLEISQKQRSNFANIKEVSIHKPYQTLTSSPEKLAIVFFISEILSKTIDEEQIDEALFDFLIESFVLLDNCKKPANFHIAFLAAYSIYIGIMPENNFDVHNKYFNIREGKFTTKYSKDYSMNENLSKKFFSILDGGITGFQKIQFNKNERNAIISKIINFFAYNFNNISKFKSLDVLIEVFND